MPNRLALPCAAVAVAALIGACGGSSQKHASVRHRPATTNSTPKTATPPPVLTATARDLVTGHSPTSVRAGDHVVFKIVVRPTGTAKSGALTVVVPTTQAKTLTVTAKYGGHKAKATLTSASGKLMTLVRAQYPCSLPPAALLCPHRNVKTTASAQQIRFSVLTRGVLLISALVGPVVIPLPKPFTPGSTVLPAYAVTSLLTVSPPPPKTPPKTPRPGPKPAPVVTAAPGDSVGIVSILSGGFRGFAGALQPVTVIVNQGPATSIQISASTPGGRSTAATIKSASGSPIALVLPRYTCYIAPYPSPCPALSTKLSKHRYEIEFLAAPGSGTIPIRATVAAG